MKSIAIADSSDASLLEQDTEHHGNPRAPYHRRARNPSSRTRHGSIYLHRAFLIGMALLFVGFFGGGLGLGSPIMDQTTAFWGYLLSVALTLLYQVLYSCLHQARL